MACSVACISGNTHTDQPAPSNRISDFRSAMTEDDTGIVYLVTGAGGSVCIVTGAVYTQCTALRSIMSFTIIILLHRIIFALFCTLMSHFCRKMLESHTCEKF